jgi:hypothetical protein
MSRKIVWLMVGLLLVALVGSTALAAPVKNIGKIVDNLWGSDITAGELLQLTWPDLLTTLPQSVWNTKVTWGESEMVFRRKKVATIEKHDAAKQLEFPFIYIHCDARINASGRNVYFGASSTVAIPPFLQMPYMQVYAYLDKIGGFYVGSTTDDGYDVWRVTTNDTADVEGQASYRTVSYHSVVAPAGYDPPTQFTVRESATIWVP